MAENGSDLGEKLEQLGQQILDRALGEGDAMPLEQQLDVAKVLTALYGGLRKNAPKVEEDTSGGLPAMRAKMLAAAEASEGK